MATEHDTLIEALQAGHMEIVRLRSEVAAKDAEIKELKDWINSPICVVRHDYEANVRALSAAKQRNEQLEGALREFGQHPNDCPNYGYRNTPGRACGLCAVLASPSEPPTTPAPDVREGGASVTWPCERLVFVEPAGVVFTVRCSKRRGHTEACSWEGLAPAIRDAALEEAAQAFEQRIGWHNDECRVTDGHPWYACQCEVTTQAAAIRSLKSSAPPEPRTDDGLSRAIASEHRAMQQARRAKMAEAELLAFRTLSAEVVAYYSRPAEAGAGRDYDSAPVRFLAEALAGLFERLWEEEAAAPPEPKGPPTVATCVCIAQGLPFFDSKTCPQCGQESCDRCWSRWGNRCGPCASLPKGEP